MADNKKYYYLKLKDNFFDSDEIKVLESMENGYKYSNILLKMYLKSLKRDGLMMFKERIPYNAKMISTITGHNVNDVKQALELFDEMDLIEILSNGAIYMTDIQNFIGTSSSEADRIRSYRNKIETNKTELMSGNKPLKIDVCTNVQQLNDISTPEIEIELEKELDLEKEIDLELDNIKPTSADVLKIYDTKVELPKYRSITDARRKHINARLNDYSLQEIETVLDKASKSTFLKLKENKWFNFDWIFNPNNFIKILEGNYDDKTVKEQQDTYESIPEGW